jgi:geranyl-CoA carboxylase alpha subunit
MREVDSAFGDPTMFIEQAVVRPRHIEVQILADATGETIHLFERDCSVQRRFQKVIEEAPSPAVDAELRARMGELAVRAAQSARYVGAGTVELLLTQAREVYFLEMNTRLQVEHPVTELITGLDLVAWQLRVAEGEPLPLAQQQVQLSGHAIEVRLYAEDPARSFLPATGQVRALALPDPALARFDHGLAPGSVVSAHYDPLLGKLIAHGADREQARRKLLRALDSLCVLGVQTNQSFLRAVLEHETFVAGRATTDFLDRSFDAKQQPAPEPAVLAAAALLFASRQSDPRSELAGFSNCVGLRQPLVFETGAERHPLAVEPASASGARVVHVGQTALPARVIELTPDRARVQVAGSQLNACYAFGDPGELFLQAGTAVVALRDVTQLEGRAARSGAASGKALAPMDGAVVDVPVSVGERVTRGQTLAVLEAMKLELEVAADRDGVVAAVHVARGAQVKARQVLVELAAGDRPAATTGS